MHILFEFAFAKVQNNNIIEVDTKIILDTRSQVGGLVLMKRKKIELKKSFRVICIFL